MWRVDTCFAVLLLLTVSVTLAFQHSREKRELLRRSKRRWVLSTIELTEEEKPPYPKLATQLFNDQEVNYTLRYSIKGQGVTEPPLGVFSINEATGEVYVNKPVDREVTPMFHIMFDVDDRKTGKPVDRTLSFDVVIKDINDNPPFFHTPVINVDVKESKEEGNLPISLSALDPDEINTDNSKVSMRIVSQEPAYPPINIRDVTSSQKQLTFKGCFNYDIERKYKVLVEARDHGTPSLSSTATVNINILDANTHLPEIAQFEYKTEVMENVTNKEILRIKVKDKDMPNTPASKAKFTILKGNEQGNFKIETDPDTNEGVLTVIKAKDYERTTFTNLQIDVQNEEPLFVCGTRGSGDPRELRVLQPINVSVAVLDANDPPEFKNDVNHVYQTEEAEPGVIIFTPEVTDVDSDVSKIRFEKVVDPENWVTVDAKTGAITTVKKLDRESPYVNNSIYTIKMRAIDDGKPPGTTTATMQIHLADLNDNMPFLVNQSMILCGNKDSKVEVKAHDLDAHPYGGPFIFSLRDAGGDAISLLKSRWKLDPDTGMSATLVSLKSLAYGNYTVPLTVLDQQGKGADHDLHVHVCDCGEEKVCRGLKAPSSMLDSKGITVLIAGLILLLLLLFFIFKCGQKKMHPVALRDEGSQTLIKYNEEGGGAECKAEPMLLLSQAANSSVETDGKKRTSVLLSQVSPVAGAQLSEGVGTIRNQNHALGSLRQEVPTRQYYSLEQSSRKNTIRSGRRTYSRSQSFISDRSVMDHIDRRLYEVGEKEQEALEYHPHEYGYEGRGSHAESLESLSSGINTDDLNFLQDLGPKFNQLGSICSKVMAEKNIQM